MSGEQTQERMSTARVAADLTFPAADPSDAYRRLGEHFLALSRGENSALEILDGSSALAVVP